MHGQIGERAQEFDASFVITQIEHQELMDIANMVKEAFPRMRFKVLLEI